MAFNKNLFKTKMTELIDAYGAQYQKGATKYGNELIKAIDEGFDLQSAMHRATVKAQFAPYALDGMVPKIMEAACYGYGIMPSMVADPKGLMDKLLNTSWTGDKMNLSTRLHGAEAIMKQNVVDTISNAMRQNKSFTQMAERLYKGYGNPSVLRQADLPKYMERLDSLAKKISAGDVAALREFRGAMKAAQTQINKLSQNGAPNQKQRAAYQGVVDASERFAAKAFKLKAAGQFEQAATKLTRKALTTAVDSAMHERTRYYAERIARTEIARAYADGFFADNDDDENVIAYRWVLGTRHPFYDICDVHSKANIFGFGSGIYPKSKLPMIPAHPHCGCHYAAVLVGDEGVFSEVKYDRRAMERFLKNGCNDDERKALMGVAGSQQFKQGEHWEGLLRHYDGYGGAKPRLKRRDFVEPAPTPPIVKPAPPTPAPAPITPPKPKPAAPVKPKTWNEEIDAIKAKKFLSEADVSNMGEILMKQVEKQMAEGGIGFTEAEYNRMKKYENELAKLKLAGKERSDEFNRIAQSKLALVRRYREWEQQIATEMRSVLYDYRPFGSDATTPKQVMKGDKALTDVLERALENYPREWIKKSAEASRKMKMNVIKTNRGYYQPMTGEIATSGGGSGMLSTFVHELGHRMEAVIPDLLRLENDFYRRRTVGETPKWLGRGYDQSEVTKFDKFLEPYMGKEYTHAYKEVVSMGMQNILGPSRNTDVPKMWTQDRDMLRFIIGTLVGL